MIIYLIGLFFFSIVIAYILKKDIVYIIPLSVMATIITLYCFSMVKLMEYGVYFIYAIGILAIFAFLYLLIKHKKDFIQSISFLPIIVMTLFGLLSLWMHNGRAAVLWDELSHWARVVKDMFYLDALGTHPDSMVKFQNYPPGSALLQYLFVKIRGSYVEAELYHGVNVIYFSLMLPLFKNVKSKNVLKVLIYMLITIIMPTLFFDKIHMSLYVDGLMGILFSYILLIYFTNKTNKFTFINIAVAVFVLTIIKPAGAGIAVLAIFVIMMDALFANRDKYKEYFKNNNTVSAIICILLPVISLLIAKLSWDIYLQNSNASIAFDTAKISLQKIIDVLVKFNGTEVQKEIMLNFFKATISFESTKHYTNFIFNVPPITYIVLFMFAGAGIYYKSEKETTKRRVLVAGISLLIACAVYLFIQLCSYLFLFSAYEGKNLASFTRYLGTFFLGIYVLIVAYLLTKNNEDTTPKTKIQKHLIIFFVMITFTSLYSFMSVTALAPFSTRNSREIRDEYIEIADIKDEIEDDETIYFIDIGSNGYSYYMCDYMVYPIRLNSLGSIGTSKYYENDVWTRIVTPEELKEDLLNNYHYLYVHQIGYNFSEEYGYLFGGAENILEHTLYYVDQSDDDFVLKKHGG